MDSVVSDALPTPDGVQRWGERALGVALGLSLVLLLGSVFVLGEYVLLVPALLLVLLLGWALFRHPMLNLTVLLASSVTLLRSEPGIQLDEILFVAYMALYLGHWLVTRVLADEDPVICTVQDRIVAFMLMVGVPVATALGFGLGAEPGILRGELTGFLMLTLYFPVKDACVRYRYGPFLVAGAILWIGLYTAVQNIVNFRSILASADQIWRIADARPGLNEIQLLFGSLGALILVVRGRSPWLRTAALVLFGLCFVALIMTKSRGYWVDFMLGAALLTVLLNRVERRRLFINAAVGGVALAGAALMTLGSGVSVILGGIVSRFATLETAATADISLVNRFSEWAGALDMIRLNPILGHGFGTPFAYYSPLDKATVVGSFIHSAYFGLWFKFGLWGLALMVFLWLSSAWRGYQVHRDSSVQLPLRSLGLFAAISLAALFPAVNTSNPFILPQTILGFTFMVGLANGVHQRWERLRRRPVAPLADPS